MSRGEFTDLMGRATASPRTNHLSRDQGLATNSRRAFCISARTFRQRTSRCRHEECGESTGSTTRTPYRRPVSARGNNTVAQPAR